MLRGDSLIFAFQVGRDLTTGELSSHPVMQLPPGSVPQDLTGFRIWFTAKTTYVDPDLRAVAQLDNLAIGGVTVTNAVQGIAIVNMPAIKTAGFPDAAVMLYYDIQTKDGAGNIKTTENGSVTVFPDVTRATQ